MRGKRSVKTEVAAKRLLGAVVVQAAEDYRAACRELRRHPRNRAAERMKEETEHFFLSEDFCLYTKLRGELLLNKLMKETEREHAEKA